MILQNLSIKNKMIGIVLAVSFLAMGGGFALDLLWDINDLKKHMTESAMMNAKLVGEYCITPLAFEDKAGAVEILKKLHTIPDIVNGYVYDDKGILFASYNKIGKMITPPLLRDNSSEFIGKYLHVSLPLIYKDQGYGEIYLRISSGALYREIQKHIFFMLSLITGLMFVAYFLANKLQKVLSWPILNLANITKKISKEGDYSLRVERKSADEIGILYDRFNEMLKQINIREDALKARQLEIETLNENLEKRVQKELEKSRQKDHLLIQQSRLASMGEMIGNIAHQWRQPLNALNILLYNIQLSFEEEEITKENLDKKIARGANIIKKMSSTIDDFRNFFEPNKEEMEFCVNQAIKESYAILEANFKHLDISIMINEKEKINTLGFSNEYSQVIINILNNSKDAIRERNIKGEIKIDILSENGSCVVRIKDNGGGIPENVLNNIFDPYFTTKEQGKGTGIGLYMSKMIIVNNMGGQIEGKNIDDGVEFAITVPIQSD